MLPQKSFMAKDCLLYESDFDVTACVKLHRIMELMQDLATTHADKLGCGWDDMDKHGLFWILSKVKIEFYKPVTRHSRRFTLYTWPQPSNRLFIERRFSAADGSGEEVFSASTIWMILNRDNRVFASQQSIEETYRCDFDTTPCTCSATFARIRRDESYTLAYQRHIRRTDLDINRHVNNTNYINYALDVLDENERVTAAEIVYHKELTLGDVISVYVKRDGNKVYVTGERDVTCFTVKLTVADN